MDRGTTRGGVDGGRLIVALGAVMLLVALFLDWYGSGRGVDDGFSAWTAFELVDIILALLALAAIAAALEPMARGTSRIPDTVGAAAGPAALLLVIVSILNFPPAAQGFEGELKVGAWLALAGAAIMCAGALLALNRVSLVVTPRDGQVPHTPSPTRPSVERGEDMGAAETETRPLPPRG
ncbi:MAG: hypothetical protein WKF62_09470 [Solirubrobacterales bacterium]